MEASQKLTSLSLLRASRPHVSHLLPGRDNLLPRLAEAGLREHVLMEESAPDEGRAPSMLPAARGLLSSTGVFMHFGSYLAFRK